jgi:molecular chaperone DnaJ
MNSKQSLYSILDIPNTATDEEIRKAYRRAAIKYHPDKNTDNVEESEQMFKKVTDAYGILSDPEKRKMYDDFGHIGDLPPMPDLSELMNMFSNHGFSSFFRQGRENIEPEVIYVDVTYNEVFWGCIKSVSYNLLDKCSDCKGSGALDNNDIIRCIKCGGAGVCMQQITPFMMTSTTCIACSGKGNQIKPGKGCPKCQGNKYTRTLKTIEVKLPKGISNGQQHKLEGKGSYHEGSASYRDLIVVFQHVSTEDPDLHLKVDDRHNTEITIDLKLEEVLCGFQRSFTLFNNKITVYTDKYVNPSKVFTLRGLGLPTQKRSKINDLNIHLNVLYPDDDTRFTKYQDVFCKVFKYSKLSIPSITLTSYNLNEL